MSAPTSITTNLKIYPHSTELQSQLTPWEFSPVSSTDLFPYFPATIHLHKLSLTTVALTNIFQKAFGSPEVRSKILQDSWVRIDLLHKPTHGVYGIVIKFIHHHYQIILANNLTFFSWHCLSFSLFLPI